MGGVARRAWARNPAAMKTSQIYNETQAGKAHITLPYLVDDALLNELLGEAKE